ncbi:hypothetical protein [Alteromonas lipotrueiana]|uniref:hypothetical protein n=1 Tax=Alteromonas lipotrueiana TaxID=2803815 RepID=UPI001C442445|nr:hypothetical protein [Alteromonas lipotrueiana]
MGYKFTYFPRPIITDIKTVFEATFVELSLCIICGILAYVSYGELLQIFLPFTIVALACLFLTIHNIYVMIKDIKENRAGKGG